MCVKEASEPINESRSLSESRLRPLESQVSLTYSSEARFSGLGIPVVKFAALSFHNGNRSAMPLPQVYLDYASTCPVDQEVIDGMLPYFGLYFGNPSSTNQHGIIAAEAVETAAGRVASLIGCRESDIIWTSGATESINLAIRGYLAAIKSRPIHVISQKTEHKAVLDTLESIRQSGVDVTLLDVDSSGLIRVEALAASIRATTVLVSIMAANNETGVIFPLEEIGQLCAKSGIAFHTDASQIAGKLPIDFDKSCLSMLSMSGHKLYGPKGVGVLAFRKTNLVSKLIPMIEGGGQQRGARSGTLNVPGIVGLGIAAMLSRRVMTEDSERILAIRTKFESELEQRLPEITIQGSRVDRLPNITNVAFKGVDAESLLLALDRISASTGSACTSTSIEPSHVLRAMGMPRDLAKSAVRFSFGRGTSMDELSFVVESITDTVRNLRALYCEPLV